MNKPLCVMLAVMLSITVIPFASERVEAAPSGWELDSVAPVSSSNFFIDMALDNDGNPYIGYISTDDTLNCVHYRSDVDMWTTTTVSTSPSAAEYDWSYSNFALDVDSDGYPHILYFEWNSTASGEDLVYASYVQSSVWSKEIVVAANTSPGADSTEYVSLAIGNDDIPRVVYSDMDNGYLCYGERTVSGWVIENAREFYNFFLPVLALDSNNAPHIGSYYQNTGKFVLTTKSGSTWSTETISPHYANDYTPMVMDHADKLHTCYHAYSGSYSSMGLRYLREGETSWTTEELILDGRIGTTTSIAVDGSNNPHISCLDDNTYELKYFWNTTGEWANTTVYTATDGSGLEWTCIDLDQFGNPSIAFIENDGMGTNYLKFAKAIAVNPPSAPIDLQGVPGDGRVDLSWGAVVNDGGSQVTGYNVYRGTSPGNESLLISINNGSRFSYSSTGLVNGVTYYYQVSAYNGVGEGPRSTEISVTPVEAPSEPSAPTNFQAAPSSGRVDLTWEVVGDDGGAPVTGYRIYSGTSSGGEILLTAITSGSTFSYSNTGLNNGVTYYYQISAVNSIGEGPRSGEISATPIGVPEEPESVVAHRGNGQAILTWNAPYENGGSPIINYTIYRSTLPNQEVKLVKIGVSTTYTDNSVTNGQIYYYKVTATNSVGESARSSESATIPTDNMTPVITLGYDAGVLDNVIPISGSGFDSNVRLDLYFGTFEVLWIHPPTTAPNGTFSSSFRVPPIANDTYLVKVVDPGANEAHSSFTIGQAIIFLGTDNGSPGVEVSISGYGFQGDSSLKLHVGTFHVLWSEDTDAAGWFNTTFTIPNLASGEYEVIVTDPKGTSASSDLEIGIPIIVLGYDSGCLDSVILISGSGFDPDAHLLLHVGDLLVPFIALTDANGSFSSSFLVPDIADGEYVLSVRDPNFHMATTNFTVGTPHIFLGTDNASPQVIVPISGYGFHHDSALRLYIGSNQILWSCITDDAGAFNTTFKVRNLASGEYQVNVTDHEGYSAFAAFELGMPSITLGLPTGCPDAVIPISGTGFSPSSHLKLSFGGNERLWAVMTNSVGSFSSTFDVPNVADGSYVINVSDQAYHLASANFTVGDPSIEIGDVSGEPGSDISISGQGFAPNSQLSLYIGTEHILWSVQTDASGSFSSTFQVPDLAPGSYDLEIMDVTGHNATGEVEVLSPDKGPGMLIYAGIGAIILVGAGAAVMLYRRRMIK